MIVSALGVFVLFSIIVLVHEFGHFWVAKRTGIKVEKFSLGFGPKVFAWEKGETVYQVGILPFGGFVKMAGEEFEDKTQFAEWEYMGQAPGRRSLVVLAGSLHNLVFGFLLLIPIFMLGVPGYDGTKIGSFVEGMPAEKSGLKVNDEVVEINGKACREWLDVIQYIRKATKEASDRPVTVKVRREGRLLTFQVKPVARESVGLSGKKELAYLIGISPKEKQEKYGLAASVIRAGREFGKMCYGVYYAFKLLLTRQASAKLLSGPVGIAQWGAELVHAGLARFLYFMSFISVNLCVVNLLPLPALDGGHLFGLLVERIRRKRPTRKLLEMIQYVGVFALISLALFVTYNDIIRILEEKLKK